MSGLRDDLAKLVDDLLRGTSPGDGVDLDAIGVAIGARAISQDEIDGVLRAIEERGRRVTSAAGGRGEAHLKQVLAAARELVKELGRSPRPAEIAERAKITEAEVKHALALSRIMQR